MSRSQLKRLISYGLGLLGLLLLLCVGAISLLLYHPDAPRWMLEQVRSHTDMSVEIEQHQGVLASPLSLQGIRLQGDFGLLEIGQVELDWRPAALWRWELHIASLNLSKIHLSLPPASPDEAEPSRSGFDGIELPLGLRIDQLALQDLRIEQPQQAPRLVERLHLQAWSEADRIHIKQLNLVMPELELQAAGQLGFRSPWPAELKLEWRLEYPEWPLLEGQGRIVGDLKRLQVEQSISGAVSGELQASLNDLTQELSWHAIANLQPSELGGWLVDFPLRVSGELSSQGDLNQIGLEADLDLASSEHGEAALTLKGEYTGGRLKAESLRLETPAGGRLDLNGYYEPDDGQGSFDAELTWQELQWPLQGDEPQVKSEQGRVKLSGTPSDYAYQLSASLHMPEQPLAEIESSGTGDLQAIRLDSWLAKLDPGQLQGQGEVKWQPALEWRFTVEGEGVDPSLWLEALPGRLALSGEAHGRMTEEGLSGGFVLDRLQGRVRDYPVMAEGRASLDGGRLELDNLYFTSGRNRVDVSGEISRELALVWRIEAPELQGLWPGLEGNLAGSGRLDGSLQAPRLQAALQGGALSYADQRADSLKLDADLSLTDRQKLSLHMIAEGLQTPAGNWRELDLDLSGSLSAHRMTLSLQGGEAPRLALGLEAGWTDKGLWQGHLDQLSLKLSGQPAWQLAKAAGFALGAERQRLEKLCLQAGEAKLCGELDRAASGAWETKLDAEAFPLETLQPWLPEGWTFHGLAQGRANLSQGQDEILQGEWRVRLSEAQASFGLAADAKPIKITNAELLGGIDRVGARTRVALALDDLGELRGEINLPSYRPFDLVPAQQPLQGELRFSLQDLSRLSQLSPRLLNPRGDIRGDFTLDGTLAQPRLLGSADLERGALDIPELGLELREIDLSLSAPSLERLALQGGLLSGEGRLSLQGELALDAEAGFPAQLELSGKKITVANIPEAEIRVTPTLKLERDREGTRLQGRIDIPYARLRPRKLPKSAVKVSSDLVLVGEDQVEQRPFDPRLSTNLQLVMGDRVSFDGFGLRGKLTGRLIVIDEPKRPVIGRGRIGISEGTYRAYGQDLSIERGYALFADSPVDNPGLDVRAVRELEQVTAGVQVSGTLKKPKIDLFSTPSMSQGDALSYLLTGRPRGEGGGESLGIAAAIKASGAGTVAEEIGRQFGLEELRFDAGSGLEEASVVAGTYLSPRLYIQYINELASRETKVRLRYDINRRLQLEAETGKTQAGDLYYTFDR
jgi:translocation and assembly module TamB